MNSSDNRVERLRRVNRYKAIQSEIAREKEEEEFAVMREKKQRAAAVDEALANELAEQQRLEQRDEKMLQMARDFPEVRELERALRDAYLKKGRSEQMSDKSAEKQQRIKEERDYIEFLNEKDRLAEVAENTKRLNEIEAFRQHQATQLELIKQHQQMAREEAEARRKERIAVDNVVARVQEKDFLDALSRREKQRKLQEEQAEFYRLREDLKKAERDREAKEEAAIAAYLAEKSRRKEAEEKVLVERDAIKARILDAQCRRIAEEQRKKDELENLLREYYEEERLAKEMALQKAERESRERMASAVTKENLQLIEQRRQMREQELAEEMKFRQERMEALAADAKLAQLSKQRQIQLKKEHIAETQRMLEERQRQKAEENRIAKQVEEQDIKREQELQEYIRRARAQLLEEHLPKLGSYAPVGHLKPDEKLRFLSSSTK